MIRAVSKRWRPVLLALRRDRDAMIGLALVVGLALFALVGPWLTADPNVSDFSLERALSGGPPSPSPEHPLGADTLFRDVLARLAHGARLSLGVAIGATLLATSIGASIGIASGYAASLRRLSWIDGVLMRFVDIALAFPYLLLVTAIGVAVDRADATTVILILGATSWTGMARVVRARALQICGADYVVAARALGASHARIMWRHVFPGVTPVLLVIGSQAIAGMILAEAVLGYLTVGVEPPQSSWGRMINEAQGYLGVEPLLLAAPGVAILIAVLGFTRLGDGLKRAIEGARPAQRRSIPADLLIAAAALLLLAFVDPEPLAPPAAPTGAMTPQPGGVFRLATSVEIRDLDSATAYDQAARAVDGLVFAKLVTWDEQGRLVPDLAERFQVSDDGKTYTFVLRPGLRFHDGSLLNAQDVKRSLQRTLHPETACPAAELFSAITGFEAYRNKEANQLSGVAVIDQRTVAITTAHVEASLPARLTMNFAAPVCPSSGTVVDKHQPVTPCGAGPFRVTAFVRGERVSLARFDDYYQPGRPYLDGVEYLLGVPHLTQRYRFEQGELDLVDELVGIDVTRFSTSPAWASNRQWSPAPQTMGVFMNTEVAPFDNVHMRRAVAFAVDPSNFDKVRSTVAATDRLIPPSIPGPKRTPLREHSIERALREMELAGYAYDPETQRGGYPNTINYLAVPNSFSQSTGEIIQQQLAGIGIDIRLELVSFSELLTKAGTRGAAQMGWRGWGATYPDGAYFFEPILTTAAIRDTNSQNVSFYSNPELDALLLKARSETDDERRFALLNRAEEIVRDDAPWVPLYGTRALRIWRTRVRNFHPYPFVPLQLNDVWLQGAP